MHYLFTGNWDLVGNNTPIFFIRDPILFPSFIHTQKRNPATHLKDPDAMWDFITLRPETTHQVILRKVTSFICANFNRKFSSPTSTVCTICYIIDTIWYITKFLLPTTHNGVHCLFLLEFIIFDNSFLVLVFR